MKMMMDDGQDLLLLYKYIHLETDKLETLNSKKTNKKRHARRIKKSQNTQKKRFAEVDVLLV